MARKSPARVTDQYRDVDFGPLLSLDPDELVTHAHVRDVALPSGRRLALITLDNGVDHTRPNTFGPASLIELLRTLDLLAARADAGEIDAVGVTGKPYILAAGADLTKAGEIPDRETGLLIAQLGHAAFGRLSELGVPSFAFINGLALGGGVEIGLHADYRTIDSSIPALGLPEVFLGIVPGWGGSWLLPNLIGIENALQVVISNPLQNNRTLRGAQALKLGIADAMFGPANFLEDSFRWADGVLDGSIAVKRPHEPGMIERTIKWDIAIGIAEKTLARRLGRVAKSPYAALSLLKAAKSSDRAAGFRAEDETLADLLAGDQFRASLYAFDLVQKRARKPAGAPDRALARPITKVGVVGAGLMASQFALLFLRRLQVPVVITDVDQDRIDTAVAGIRGEVDALLERGRIDADEASKLRGMVQGTTDRSAFAGCDWVIEAVFEEVAVKQQVFAELEKIVSSETIFATNTSSLSVGEIGSVLERPERLVGFHFFNPVSMMPLIEVVRSDASSDAAVATALATAAALGKNPVITTDSPGFVVNRVLAKLLSETMQALAEGASIDVVKAAIAPFGLPMDPFVLMDLVGLRIAAHVLQTHHAAFPERFQPSPALDALADHGTLLEKDGKGEVTGIDKTALRIIETHRTPGGAAPDADALRIRLETGLADEIRRMLDEGVVAGPEDIDLCMIFGAGWPFQMGGATPYLDRVGASERAFGGTFHTPPIRGVVG